jgi:thioredoxin 1
MSKAVTASTFQRDVLEAAVPVIVYIWAEWSGPGRVISVCLERIEKEVGAWGKFVRINADENRHIASCYDIEKIPTMLIFIDGDLASARTGSANIADLAEWIFQYIR